ncbi:spermatid differentiation, partial [Pristimantis euphronides]
MAAEREEGHRTRGGVTLQWEELQAQEAELTGHLFRAQPLIVENEVKRQQALTKARRAQEIQKMKEQQLRLLQGEQQLLVRRKQKLQRQVQHYSKFSDYMDRAAEAAEEFQVSGDVLRRFHALLDTARYLQQAVQDAEAAIDQLKGKLFHFLEEKNDEVLQLDNQLGHLQAALEEAKSQRLLWESHWAHIQNTARRTTLLIGTIKMAVLNLVQRIDLSDRNATLDNTTKQLELVR